MLWEANVMCKALLVTAGSLSDLAVRNACGFRLKQLGGEKLNSGI
jgi:hypothetical protein